MPSKIVRALDQTLLAYQRSVSPYLGHRCRFFPSCSEYARQCLSTYPLPVAVGKSAWRIIRCQPWNSGGIDLP